MKSIVKWRKKDDIKEKVKKGTKEKGWKGKDGGRRKEGNEPTHIYIPSFLLFFLPLLFSFTRDHISSSFPLLPIFCLFSFPFVSVLPLLPLISHLNYLSPFLQSRLHLFDHPISLLCPVSSLSLYLPSLLSLPIAFLSAFHFAPLPSPSIPSSLYPLPFLFFRLTSPLPFLTLLSTLISSLPSITASPITHNLHSSSSLYFPISPLSPYQFSSFSPISTSIIFTFLPFPSLCPYPFSSHSFFP